MSRKPVTTDPDHAVPDSGLLDDDSLEWIRAKLAADPVLLLRLTKLIADQLMTAEADRLCRADPDGSGERVNRRNGYRPWRVETGAGVVEVAVPRLRRGSYAPPWLLGARPAWDEIEKAACRAYVHGATTRTVADLVAAIGMAPLDPAQIAAVGAAVNAAVGEERRRPLENAPYRALRLDSHTLASDRRIRNMTARIGTAPDGDGAQEVLGLAMTVVDDETAWRVLLRGLVRRGLTGVEVVRADTCTPALARAVGSELAGAVCEGVPPANDSLPEAGSATEPSPWAPPATPEDDAAAERRRPEIVVRRHGRHRHADAPPDDGQHPPRRRTGLVVSMLAAAVLILAIALATIWWHGSDPGERVTPSPSSSIAVAPTTAPTTTASTIPTTTAAVSPATVTSAPSQPATFESCADSAPGGRAPWLDEVLCATGNR